MRARLRGVYYGWAIALTLAITELTSWGVLYYAFAVVIVPLEQEQGWTRSQTSAAFSLALLLSGLAAPAVGRWLDRHGSRGLMTFGSMMAFALVWAWSEVTTLSQFYLVWAGLGLTMAAVLYEPAFATVATWFTRRRSQALTLVTFFGGMASLIFTPLTAWLVEQQGWRAGIASLAIILGVITIPLHALVLRRAPTARDAMAPTPAAGAHSPGLIPSVPPAVALRSRAFWALTGAFTLNAFCAVVVGVHLIPYLLDRGYDASFAAIAAGLLGGMQIPGRLLFAPLEHRLSRATITVVVFLLQALAFLLLLAGNASAGVFAFVMTFGVANGMATLLRASLVAELFGPAHYGSLNGMLSLSTTSARALAPLTAGLLYTTQGSYRPVLWLLLLLSVLATLCARAADTGRRRQQAY